MLEINNPETRAAPRPTTLARSRLQRARGALWLGLLVAVLAIGGLALARLLAQPYVFHGSLIDPPAAAPDFTLADQTGRPFRLSAQAGSVVLLYFGYTSCPDACPATLAEFKLVRRRLGPQAERVRFVFVTVDPLRDSAAQLGTYLSNFDPSFVGLSGTPAELRPVWRSYGVSTAVRAANPAAVDHSDRVYAIDARGRLRLTYALDIGAETLADDVRALIDEAR